MDWRNLIDWACTVVLYAMGIHLIFYAGYQYGQIWLIARFQDKPGRTTAERDELLECYRLNIRGNK